MRPLTLVALALFVSLGSCSDRGTKHIQPYWLRSYSGYELHLQSLTRSHDQIAFRPIKDQRGNCYDDLGIEGCIAHERASFWLDVTNKGGKAIRLLWPEVRYVDETGRTHGVYHWSASVEPPNNVLTPNQPPTTVQPNQSEKENILPGYKTYMIGSRQEAHVFKEPLIPTRLDDKNEQQMKAYVDDLAKRQVPVKLILPIEIDGVRYDYTFTFVLRDRAADLPKQ